MFQSADDWESGTNDKPLTDALFGNVSANATENLVKATPTSTKAVDPKLKLTRERWKRRQKNKRRAKKRNNPGGDTQPQKNTDLNGNSEPQQDNDTEDTDLLNLNTRTKPLSKINKGPPKAKQKRFEGKSNDDDKINFSMPTPQNAYERKENVGGLQEKLLNKLSSSRFRFINEQMYTSHSKETVQLFENDPQAFSIYHKGYLNQVSKWPVKPLDLIISWIKARSPKLVVADFGCGEAFLAQNVKNVVHSFDLVAVNKFVTVADITKVPLEDQSVDVAVFCLSLMGTNFVEFLLEANRVLKIKSILKIAEVASRFHNPKGFILNLKKLGFELIKKDVSNTHFYMFDFRKTKHITAAKFDENNMPKLKLQPCLYKKR
uniref:Ribosomal RNA-processing protein 8 n=1 Tax=Phallusia mammillata TaxID=59560 RepID=A0A6F9DRQ9_9ASCI|nr:ribosomal RNA-processing protein 8 [Phallusia mammillata]